MAKPASSKKLLPRTRKITTAHTHTHTYLLKKTHTHVFLDSKQKSTASVHHMNTTMVF